MGGAETQAHRTAIGLARRDHAVTVLARAVPGDVPGVHREHGVTWVRLRVPSVPGVSFPAHALRFRAAWRRQGGPAQTVRSTFPSTVAMIDSVSSGMGVTFRRSS